jgi:hypothetical protein
VGPRLGDEARQQLLGLIRGEPDWGRRLAAGPARLEFTTVAASADVAEKAYQQAVNRLATREDVAGAAEALDTCLLHAPGDRTAWFLRAACHLALNDGRLAERDVRRLLVLEGGNNAPPYSWSVRHARLERVQGRFRDRAAALANRLSLTPAPAAVSLSRRMKELCEEGGVARTSAAAPPRVRPVGCAGP